MSEINPGFRHLVYTSLSAYVIDRPAWTRSCAACCRWPCFGRRVGL